MSTNHAQFEKWSDVLDYKARILYSQIALLQKGIADEGGSDELIESLCAPYVELLKSMYAEDYPLAKAIEESDLLLRLEGPAINRENPRVSIITGVFKKVRTQVANVAKAIAQLSESKRTVPREMDLGLSAYARGSLILGFTLPSASEIEEAHGGQMSLLGEQDPLYQAAKQAIRTIGVVTQHVTEDQPLEELAKAIPDAKVRDVALAAVKELTPTGRQGIDSVIISGKDIGGLDRTPLTPNVREAVSAKLEHPVIGQESAKFIGDVREIDLDARRFELRHIENMTVNVVRCSYTNQTDDEAAEWLNKHIRVVGNVERDQTGKARLLDIVSLEVLD